MRTMVSMVITPPGASKVFSPATKLSPVPTRSTIGAMSYSCAWKKSPCFHRTPLHVLCDADREPRRVMAMMRNPGKLLATSSSRSGK